MNDKVQGRAAAPRRFARKTKKSLSDMGLSETLKYWFEVLKGNAGFMVIMGFLIVGSGAITFTAFRNAFGVILLDIGGTLFLLGLLLKVYEVLMKLIGD